jgi:hypothetical protein
VSWAIELKQAAQKRERRNRDKYRCMMINSVSKAIGRTQFAGQINGKFQTVLLKAPPLQQMNLGRKAVSFVYRKDIRLPEECRPLSTLFKGS